MKRFSILLLLTVFCSVSCKKTGGLLINSNDLAGSWLLKEYSGGVVYRVVIPTDSIAIEFERSGIFTFSTNDTLTARGSFTITKAAEDDYYSPTTINFSTDDGNKIIYGIVLKHDSLFLSEECCDRFSYVFAKRK